MQEDAWGELGAALGPIEVGTRECGYSTRAWVMRVLVRRGERVDPFVVRVDLLHGVPRAIVPVGRDECPLHTAARRAALDAIRALLGLSPLPPEVT